MNKFQNKYRIPSARLQNWDYGANGAYFITICTQHKEFYFGDIDNGIMTLSELGQMAERFWMEIPNHFPFIELGNFVVMPNHVHGILIINNSNDESRLRDDESRLRDVQTRLIASLPENHGGFSGDKNPMFHDNISRIIRWYKGRCAFEMRKIHADFGWQPRFHDHIIRNSVSFENIQNYIVNNPLKWGRDKFFQ